MLPTSSSTIFAHTRFLARRGLKLSLNHQTRYLNIHGYQSQELLRNYGVSVPRGAVAQNPEEVEDAIRAIGQGCVLKAQLLQRNLDNARFENGLQGGAHVVRTPDQGKAIASKIIGNRVASQQPDGQAVTVSRIYVAENVTYSQTWYLGMTIDRENYSPVIIVSKKGGYDIKEIAQAHPESLLSFNFTLSEGITPDLVAQMSARLGISPAASANLQDVLTKICSIFSEKDATFLEINPLALLPDGTFTCVDSRFSFDDDAAKRQPEIFSVRDKSQEVKDEVEAEKYNLVYIRMDGNIGNIVNGAGLAMATNDAIGLHGGASANFLDAGGQATKETMQQAFGIVMRDERVKSILVNIYGGITRCDMIAESIIGAATEMELSIPVVVRLQGTNSAEGLRMLAEADLGLHVESDFGQAAQRAVELANL